MRRLVPLALAAALATAACSSDSDSAPTTTTIATTATAPSTEASSTTLTTEQTTSTQPPNTTAAPTTTIDEQAVLAEAEAAYLEAFEVGKEVLRNPDNPDNEDLLHEHYTEAGGKAAQENLSRTIEGNFIARENDSNPSFATIVEPASILEGDTLQAELTVCEFNSDRVFEVSAAPDGSDVLRRDDPVSILFAIRMEQLDGIWKVAGGTRGEEIRSEEEQCSAQQ